MGTAYDFIALCCKRCKVEFANKRAEIDAMPNGGVTLSVYTENDIETCRDVLFYVAQVLGGFFIINREGKLELRKYGKDPVMKVEQRHRFSSSFSDFITRYTAVSSTNKQTQIAEYYALDPVSRMLPGMRRWCGSGSPKRIIPLRREAGHCPRRSFRKWAQGQRTVPIRNGM